MSSGIICKVWNIKGNSISKGVKEQLRDSVGYILDDEKTEGTVEVDPFNQLMRECKYIENDLKTFAGAYVGGNNIISTDASEAVEEMMQVKDFYGKRDGRAALHLLISLPEEESQIRNATKLMQLCNDVLKEVFPNNQAVFAVHTNTDNLHIHAIINSVGLDGKKIHQNDKFMRTVLHPCVNKYAEKYGFGQNIKWGDRDKDGKATYPQIKARLRREIDLAIENANSFEDFVSALEKNQIKVRVGKHISLKLDGMDKAVRTHKLGANYTRDAIVERIATRRESFAKVEISDRTIQEKPEDVFVPYVLKMEKYKDMPDAQKKRVVQQLKLGKNPWRENHKMNWQLNNIADELNTAERVKAYVAFYSADGTVQGALDGIIEAKKQIAHEKKMIAYAKRKYKPILDIYEEMKPLERKAYLYEHKNVEVFRPEFEAYRNLTRRLREGYNKDVFEITHFLAECKERTLYAHAQLNELSHEYRELKAYGAKNGNLIKGNDDFIDTLGFYKNRKNEKAGMFEADAFYISSSDSNVVIRVIKTPGVDSKGNMIEKYELSVMDRSGKVIEELSNESGNHQFGKRLISIQHRYGLNSCKRFANLQLAKEYASTEAKIITYAGKDTPAVGMDNMRPEFSFMQAINHINDKKTTCVIVDSRDPAFIAMSTQEGGQLKIIVMDKNHNIQDTLYAPLVGNKTATGYADIVKFQNKYGFSDTVLECADLNDADQCIKGGEQKKTTIRRQ